MKIIAGIYKGRRLKTTTGPGFRPAMGMVRESLFSMLEARGVFWPETRVLDIFAGSGSLGFEALSRGASHVCFVEKESYAVQVIEKNAALLEVDQDRVQIRHDAAHKVLVQRPLEPYSLVFIDPPYELDALGKILPLLLRNGWLTPEAIINAELPIRKPRRNVDVFPELTVLADRSYGQTRVVLWAKANQ